MKTTTKIALAKLAYRVIHTGRSLVGLSDKCIATRNGVRFDADLSQGIDLAIFLLGRFEPSTAAALQRLTKPGDTVLDIGANIGAHTLFLASWVGPAGKVLAFEPTDYAYGRLSRNLALNTHLSKRVTPYQMFLAGKSNASAPEALYSSWPLTGSRETRHSGHLGEYQPASQTKVGSLDDVLRAAGVAKVSLIKLDVDGHECQVLAGASETLERDRPVFVMEISPYQLEEVGNSIEMLLDALLPLGYRFYDERTGASLPSSAAELRKMLPTGETRNAIARVV